MRTEWKLFGVIAAFLFVAAVVYAFWTNGQSTGASTGSARSR